MLVLCIFWENGKQKAAERDDSEPRLNEKIMAPTVRLVIDEGVA